jgi:predicted metal-dependent phosphoesterase TrpH
MEGMRQDLHLHSLVSDGDLAPDALVWEAARRGLDEISITDHDAVAAYSWEDGAVFEVARRAGVALRVGVELDADLEGTEVHVLGFDLRLEDGDLLTHLDSVRKARFERARREIEIVNGLLGRDAISEAMIFVPGRVTLMKPHFIHPLLDQGLFATYEEANGWYRRNVRSGVVVPKLGAEDAIRLIRAAGGWAALAHPAYYERSGLPIMDRLDALAGAGLDGIEVDYPYRSSSPHIFSADDEAAICAALGDAASRLGLRRTRGTDCHSLADFDRVYPQQG